MIEKNQTIKRGEIRDVTRKNQVIMKVNGPLLGERIGQNENVEKFDMYLLTNDFPKHHFVVILDIVDSLTEPGNIFYVVNLITHSPYYNNFKITDNLYNKTSTKIDLTPSYITRDKFIIPVNEIKSDTIFGHFNLTVLEKEIEY